MNLQKNQSQKFIITEVEGEDAPLIKTRNRTICIRSSEYKNRIPFKTMKVVQGQQNQPTTSNSTRSNFKNILLSNAGQSATTSQAAHPEKIQTMTTSSLQKISHNNYEIQTEQLVKNRSIHKVQNLLDKKIVKMLIIMASGEQRLITFDLPQKSCNIHDVLEEVEIPFDNNTNIGCVEKRGSEIEFVVTVGFARESSIKLISKVHKNMKTNRQEEFSATSKVPQSVLHTNRSPRQQIAVPNTSIKRMPIKGYLAVCQYCGFCGKDHAKCERCKKVFVENPKRMPIKMEATKKEKYPQIAALIRPKQAAKNKSTKRNVAQNKQLLSTAGPSTSTNTVGVAKSTIQKKSDDCNINKAPEQAAIALSSSVQRTSHNNYEIQTRQLLINRSIYQVKNSDWKNAKMSVILPSGENRLITFTLPRQSCPVQDLLKQVGVPFDDNTPIECVENPGASIEFVVTVGSAQESSSKDEKIIKMKSQEEASALRASEKISNTIERSTEEIPVPSTSAQAAAKTLAGCDGGDIQIKIINGFLALCQFCGFCGHDHAKCERCKRVFLEKPQRMLCQKVAQAPAGASSSKGPTGINPDKSEPIILTLSSDDERDDDEQMHSSANKVPVATTVGKQFDCEPDISAVDGESSDYDGNRRKYMWLSYVVGCYDETMNQINTK